jgi:hypothetical protein
MSTGVQRGMMGSIGPQGPRGERGFVGPTGCVGPTGPEGLARCFYENAVLVRSTTDPLRGIKFDLSKLTPSTIRRYAMPDANTELVGTTAEQILTNKNLTDHSNSCRATHLGSSSCSENVLLPSVLPKEGQVLTATSATTTRWENVGALFSVFTSAFSAYKDILVTATDTSITGYDHVKLCQPQDAFSGKDGTFSVTRDGIYNVNFTANLSVDSDVHHSVYVEVVTNDGQEVLARQQAVTGNSGWYPVTLILTCLLKKGDILSARVLIPSNPISVTLCSVNFNGLCSAVSSSS